MGIVSTAVAYAPEVSYWAPMSRFGFNACFSSFPSNDKTRKLKLGRQAVLLFKIEIPISKNANK